MVEDTAVAPACNTERMSSLSEINPPAMRGTGKMCIRDSHIFVHLLRTYLLGKNIAQQVTVLEDVYKRQQRRRLGTKRGFIAVKSNCSLQSYLPALHPLSSFGITRVLACTYQAISGAGKTFDTWPEMLDNVIPYIGGEEEKSEKELMMIWGSIQNDEIVPALTPSITTQCLRVPVSDGHMAAVFVSFDQKPTMEQIKEIWSSFKGVPQELELPSAPKQFLHYFEMCIRDSSRRGRRYSCSPRSINRKKATGN